MHGQTWINHQLPQRSTNRGGDENGASPVGAVISVRGVAGMSGGAVGRLEGLSLASSSATTSNAVADAAFGSSESRGGEKQVGEKGGSEHCE